MFCMLYSVPGQFLSTEHTYVQFSQPWIQDQGPWRGTDEEAKPKLVLDFVLAISILLKLAVPDDQRWAVNTSGARHRCRIILRRQQINDMKWLPVRMTNKK